MPLFSVITVTYQNLVGLQKTAASVAVQSCADYEWIVIDGGSSDGSADFLKTTPAHFVSEADNGIYDAMNKGIERATGDYLIFMNAGDMFAAPDTLARIATHIVDTAGTLPDFLYGDALEERPDGQPPAHKATRDHHKWAWGMFTHHQAMIYRRAALHDLSIKYNTTYPIAADYKLTIQLIQNCGKIINIQSPPLCLFECGGVSQTRVRQGRVEQFKIRKELKAVPLWKNIMIFAAQTLAYNLRRISPHLYWRIKSRPNRQST